MARRCEIRKVKAREVLDSRGNPTVEAEVQTTGARGRASVPSGASTGRHEALELRDGDASRFHGKGVRDAVANVNEVIAPKLKGTDAADQSSVDRLMLALDGTTNKNRLGANAILAVSMACSRAASVSMGVHLFQHLRAKKNYTLPVPMMNVINGGEHAGNDLAVQEFLIEPVGARRFSEAIRMGSEVYHSLKTILTKEYGRSAINVGDEGGFAPPLKRTAGALAAIASAIKTAGYSEDEIRIGIDAAASTFFNAKESSYTIDGETLGASRLGERYIRLADEFNILTIEDPFDEEAFGEFASFTKSFGKRGLVIGDDIYVTNTRRIAEGIKMNSTNAVLIKLNQIGTVTETVEAIGLTASKGWAPVVSHRSGETEDPFIAHLAVALETPFIKAGAPARGERVAKYNELLRIEEDLGPRAGFSGKKAGG
jgi:enolase 1/2/3